MISSCVIYVYRGPEILSDIHLRHRRLKKLVSNLHTSFMYGMIIGAPIGAPIDVSNERSYGRVVSCQVCGRVDGFEHIPELTGGSPAAAQLASAQFMELQYPADSVRQGI